MKYYIYWIRYDSHTDPLTEGYIGVSKYPDRRLKYHAHPESNNNQILYRALRKGATQEILYEYDDKNDVYAKEIELRPTSKIGWNIIAGGDSKPPIHYGQTWFTTKGKKIHTDEHKKDMSKRFGSSVWINDGQTNKRINNNEPIPAGWERGRTKKWMETRKESSGY